MFSRICRFSSLQESAGGVTHLASIVSATFMLIIIVWIGPIFKTLPRAVLSCIVIVNLRSMFLQFQTLPDLWRKSRGDFFIWISAFAGVMVFGVVGGLLCGIMALIGNLIRLNLTAKLVPIGSYEKSEYFYRVGLSTDYIYEFTGALNFVSAEALTLSEEQIQNKNHEINEQSKDLIDKILIISLARVTSVDIVGANALIAFAKKHTIYFVDASSEVKQFIPNERHFATIIDAIAARDRNQKDHFNEKN